MGCGSTCGCLHALVVRACAQPLPGVWACMGGCVGRGSHVGACTRWWCEHVRRQVPMPFFAISPGRQQAHVPEWMQGLAHTGGGARSCALPSAPKPTGVASDSMCPHLRLLPPPPARCRTDTRARSMWRPWLSASGCLSLGQSRQSPWTWCRCSGGTSRWVAPLHLGAYIGWCRCSGGRQRRGRLWSWRD